MANTTIHSPADQKRFLHSRSRTQGSHYHYHSYLGNARKYPASQLLSCAGCCHCRRGPSRTRWPYSSGATRSDFPSTISSRECQSYGSRCLAPRHANGSYALSPHELRRVDSLCCRQKRYKREIYHGNYPARLSELYVCNFAVQCLYYRTHGTFHAIRCGVYHHAAFVLAI